MDKSLMYRKMSYKAKEIQDKWKIKIGDTFVLKACYCQECFSEDDLVDECLEMDNSFIIAGHHCNKYYLFNPTLCVRGDGCRLNSTSASILVTEKEFINDIQHFNTHIEDVFWIPRQEDLQNILLQEVGYSIEHLIQDFYRFSENYNLNKMSFEVLWLEFTMYILSNKHWDGQDWS